ncbi:sigma-70 family RNA polymerase sigma factor [Gemmatimonas sp.]|uniref:sigma-70 family RNA polymerase sigma factor n=1 Tax=Gemmatimonas sp. TaxID=1962908 RepID=UPI00286DDF6E|nr:sigma-70 family RNA polymerase sigma factor [Gemmatimonas sp.]
MTDSELDPAPAIEWREVSDADLARGLRFDADDRTSAQAWSEFERRHMGAIKGFIDVRAGDLGADAGDDLLMKAALCIQRGVEKFKARGPKSFRSWCIKIADRVILDARRGRLGVVPPTGVELVSFDEMAERLLSDSAEASDPDGSPLSPDVDAEDDSPRSERKRIMRDAFASLSETDQTILWCTFINDDSDAQIAQYVAKPVDLVRKLRYKAKAKLAKAFMRRLPASQQAS